MKVSELFESKPNMRGVEAELKAHAARKIAYEKKFGPMSAHDLHSHEVRRKDLLKKLSVERSKSNVSEGLMSNMKSIASKFAKFLMKPSVNAELINAYLDAEMAVKDLRDKEWCAELAATLTTGALERGVKIPNGIRPQLVSAMRTELRKRKSDLSESLINEIPGKDTAKVMSTIAKDTNRKAHLEKLLKQAKIRGNTKAEKETQALLDKEFPSKTNEGLGDAVRAASKKMKSWLSKDTSDADAKKYFAALRAKEHAEEDKAYHELMATFSKEELQRMMQIGSPHMKKAAQTEISYRGV